MLPWTDSPPSATFLLSWGISGTKYALQHTCTVYTEWPVIPRTNDMFYFKLVSKLFIDTFLALKTYSQGEGDKYQRSV